MGMVKGNAKLGNNIWHWSLPANKKICTTASALCAADCYAKKGHYRYDNVQSSLWSNYERSRQPGFVQYMVEELQRNAVRLFRLHASGEFYKPRYMRDWINIIRRSRHTLFFGYTRSWRDEAFLDPIVSLAAKPNVRLWLSSDRETGAPPEILHTRVAYMQVDAQDIPAFPVDLIFRTKRKPPKKKIAGVMVCPVENGTTKTTCQTCRLCIDRQYHLDRINDFKRADGDPAGAISRIVLPAAIAR